MRKDRLVMGEFLKLLDPALRGRALRVSLAGHSEYSGEQVLAFARDLRRQRDLHDELVARGWLEAILAHAGRLQHIVGVASFALEDERSGGRIALYTQRWPLAQALYEGVTWEEQRCWAASTSAQHLARCACAAAAEVEAEGSFAPWATKYHEGYVVAPVGGALQTWLEGQYAGPSEVRSWGRALPLPFAWQKWLEYRSSPAQGLPAPDAPLPPATPGSASALVRERARGEQEFGTWIGALAPHERDTGLLLSTASVWSQWVDHQQLIAGLRLLFGEGYEGVIQARSDELWP